MTWGGGVKGTFACVVLMAWGAFIWRFVFDGYLERVSAGGASVFLHFPQISKCLDLCIDVGFGY